MAQDEKIWVIRLPEAFLFQNEIIVKYYILKLKRHHREPMGFYSK